MSGTLLYTLKSPEATLSDWIDSFWMLANPATESREIVVLPDGRVDLFLSRSDTDSFHISLLGIGTQPDTVTIPPGSLVFAISFRLPGAECCFGEKIAALRDKGVQLPPGFWGFGEADLDDFDLFCEKASAHIASLLPGQPDSRRQALFRLLYARQGQVHIRELPGQVYWSSRQINRYFNRLFGLPLKAYCDILRFRASFSHIKEGKLYPKAAYADQSHFIKAVKRLSGVLPKALHQNRNGRFIQFSTLQAE